MPGNEKLPPPVNLTHRVVGAVILVALAVLLLPLILSEQQPPAELNPAVDARGAGGNAAPEAAAGTATEYGVAEPPPTPAAERKPAAPSVPEQGWAVQVGVFANAGNAARLGERLTRQGYNVLLDTVGPQNEKRSRLRVGPFAGRDAAQQALQNIQQHAGVAGAVIAYP